MVTNAIFPLDAGCTHDNAMSLTALDSKVRITALSVNVITRIMGIGILTCLNTVLAYIRQFVYLP